MANSAGGARAREMSLGRAGGVRAQPSSPLESRGSPFFYTGKPRRTRRRNKESQKTTDGDGDGDRDKTETETDRDRLIFFFCSFLQRVANAFMSIFISCPGRACSLGPSSAQQLRQAPSTLL